MPQSPPQRNPVGGGGSGGGGHPSLRRERESNPQDLTIHSASNRAASPMAAPPSSRLPDASGHEERQQPRAPDPLTPHGPGVQPTGHQPPTHPTPYAPQVRHAPAQVMYTGAGAHHGQPPPPPRAGPPDSRPSPIVCGWVGRAPHPGRSGPRDTPAPCPRPVRPTGHDADSTSCPTPTSRMEGGPVPPSAVRCAPPAVLRCWWPCDRDERAASSLAGGDALAVLCPQYRTPGLAAVAYHVGRRWLRSFTP